MRTTLMQVKLASGVVLRASVVDDTAVEFSVGPETGEHGVRVSDAAAHVLLVMQQLAPRVA